MALETFTEDALEITDQLTRINDSGAEVLFLPNSSEFVRRHVLAARRAGFAGTFLGGDSWSHGIDPDGHPELHGSYFSDLWAPDRANEQATAFIEGYRETFGAMPTSSAALSYDAVMMIAQVIRQNGAGPQAIRAGLASMTSFQGVSGTIGFHGSGDPARSVFIRRLDADGTIRLQQEISPGE